MHEIFELIREVANLRSTVLIQGESGTGKELVARAIHNSGDRSAGRSWRCPARRWPRRSWSRSCSATRRARSPGRSAQKKGKFELADGGHDLPGRDRGHLAEAADGPAAGPAGAQLLPRGGHGGDRASTSRVIAATNVNLKQAVQEGKFRDDLYLPPQRDRHPDPAAARAPRGHPAAGAALHGAAVARARTRRSRRSPKAPCGS